MNRVLSNTSKLTSTAIQERKDGKYEWYELELLLPHEAIRMEFIRADKAIRMMEPIKHPWHIIAFHKWMTEFLLPSIHEHHDLEEEVLGPFYAGLGENVEFGSTHKHEELMQQMNEFVIQCNELCLLATTPSSPFLLMIEKEDKLRASFQNLKTSMFAHLHEEELFWPNILQKHGLEQAANCQKLLAKRSFGKKHVDQGAFKAFAGSVFYNAGNGRRNEKPAFLELQPWCHPDVLNSVRTRVPLVARLFILPLWQRQYEKKWKKLIDSVGTTDRVASAKHKLEMMFNF